jgi:hypothetical protein
MLKAVYSIQSASKLLEDDLEPWIGENGIRERHFKKNFQGQPKMHESALCGIG